MLSEGQSNEMNTDAADDASLEIVPPKDREPEVLDAEELRAEALKWQERVPKLASALRERSEELSAAREEIRRLQQTIATAQAPEGGDADARIRARDEVIAELESKLGELNERHREAASQLHRAELDLEDVRLQADSWKGKWQSVTSSLDSEVAASSVTSKELGAARLEWEAQRQRLVESHIAEIERSKRDIAVLRERNENLLETVELANKQLAGLSEELSELDVQRKSNGEENRQRDDQLAEQAVVIEELTKQNLEVLASKEVLSKEVEEQAARRQALAAQLEQAGGDSSALRTQLNELQEENATLTAQHAKAEAEQLEQLEQLQALLASKEAEFGDKMARLDSVTEENSLLNFELQRAKEDMQALREQLKQQRLEHAALQERFDENTQDHRVAVERLQSSLQQMQKETVESRSDKAAWAREEALLRDRVAVAEEERASFQRLLETQSSKSSSVQSEQQVELDRLEGCVEQAHTRLNAFEEERRVISAQLAKLTQQNEKLKVNLEERSQLVRELEAESQAKRIDDGKVDSDFDRVNNELRQVQHRAQTFEEHARVLEEKSASQQTLIENLEAELSEAAERANAMVKQTERQLQASNERVSRLEDQQTKSVEELEAAKQRLVEQDAAMTLHEQTTASLMEKQEQELNEAKILRLQDEVDVAANQPSEPDQDVEALAEKLRSLQGVLRERTEELNEMRWRQEQAPSANDDSVVLILNQQLKDARSENERLRKRVQTDKPEIADFGKIKGVGERLAAQLKELGIEQFDQIAALSPKDLDNEDHPLHQFRSRILRDDWIGQAKKFV